MKKDSCGFLKLSTEVGVCLRLYFLRSTFLVLLVSFGFLLNISAQNQYQNRTVTSVDVALESGDTDPLALEQFRVIVSPLAGQKYSPVRIREILQVLYRTEKIISAQVEANPTGASDVTIRFILKRKTQAERISIEIGKFTGDKVTEEDILLKLNLSNPGTAVTEQTLRANADLILAYLRERGFYNAEVTYAQTPLQTPTRVAVTFRVNPNVQAKVENFAVSIKGFDNIPGFDAQKARKDLKLQSGEFFSQRRLESDVDRIRKALINADYLAPTIAEPKVTLDSEKNTIAIEITGEIGPKVDVVVDAGKKKISKGTQKSVLPIKREGSLDQSAIIEGARKLRNYLQERGYFFSEVEAVCSVKPAFAIDETGGLVNDTTELCSALTGADLANKEVKVSYDVNLNRQFKLTDIRIEGTDKLTYEDVSSLLDSREASTLLGLIPRLGYGRGFTSNEILEEDRQRLQSVMQQLGYRQAKVTVRQGVSPTGNDLIITFAVEEGIPTRIQTAEIVGNNEIPTATLQAVLPKLEGENYSRARIRNGVQKISEIYSREGYYDAKVNYSIIEVPDTANQPVDTIKVVYTVENEGKKVFINRVLINGNAMTKNPAIQRAITLEPKTVLRSPDIFTSEQNLYASDAFKRVEIKPEPAGNAPDGSRLTDVIVNVEEQAPRVITYGGGFSTDEGAFGLFDIRHYNFLGRLQQAGARVRMSRLQQLIQLDYLNPRFIKEAKNRFAPLSITAQYQRDSTITRFFRSTFDQGTFGIVQRIDEKGNALDTFGAQTASPTLNRLSVNVETSRTISKELRSILFLRYRFEDVRLYNIESLLIAELLRPDRKTRISGFVASFVLDTRQNCSRRQSLLELIQKGEMGDPCQYNASDPTRGSFLTFDYNTSLPALGANIGFNKVQVNYQTYYTFGNLKKTTLAGRVILGAASVFSEDPNRFTNPVFAELRGSLPISERFFGGGSTTLRGFDFEGAGPRIAVVPQGIFRNNSGDIVGITPFTVPFGGNALAITNLEARVPLTQSLQVVPFYDGGNVFRRAKDIFTKPEAIPGNVFASNLRTIWTNTVGLGLRLKTPIGGSVAIDYGYLLNPPQFLIPQPDNTNAIYRIKQAQLHFRFAQIF